jgi:hypothetical protein
MSRVVQFTIPEADAAAYEAFYNGQLVTLLRNHISSVLEAGREQKLREAVRMAIKTKTTLPAEADIPRFIEDSKAVLEAEAVSK